MKRIFKYPLALFLAMSALSCVEDIEVGEQYGYLSIGVSDELGDIVEMKSEEVEEKVYKLSIVDSEGNLDAFVEDHRTISQENPVQLLMDKYEVTAICGEAGTAFNSPCYSGSSSVRVYPERAASVNIVAKMGKVKFSVHFPEDESFKSKFSLYELAVSNGEVLTFTSDDEKASDNEMPAYGSFTDTAYFEVPASKKLTYTLKMVNADGAQYTATRELEQVAVAEHYHFDFKLGEREEIDGALVLDITLDGEYDNVTTHTLILNFDKTFMPAYSTNSEFDPVPSDGTIPVWPLGNETVKKFYFDAPRGIRNLIISHLDANLLSEGLPQLVDFVDISAEDLAIMNELGITATSISKATNATERVRAEIDLTEFIKNLRVSPENENYVMSLTVIDEYDRYARCDFEFTIVSDIQAETGSVFRWSDFATFNGRYFSKNPPAGMSFMYKKVTDADWTSVDPSMISVDQQTMTFSYTAKGLAPDTDYVFRATSDRDVAEGKTSAEVNFRTYKGNEGLYNLNMDDWSEQSSAWYPSSNLSQNYIWDTANPGTASLGGVPTTPESSIVISGKAAKMKSTKVFGQFAAGNIYTGKFKEATLSPVGAKLDWGVPFESRPLALRGWYRYEPGTIDNGNYVAQGQPDYCQIQIFLTNWANAFEISTGDKRFVDTSTKNKDIIAFGAIVSQDNTTDNEGNRNGYVQFTIPLEYRNLNNPTYIVISGAASRYGDYFTGAVGSTLYLDEMELIYDPDQLTPEEYELVMKGIR